MAVLKQSSPTLRPTAPKPWPQNTEPSARTRAALAAGGRDGGGWLITPAVAIGFRLPCGRVFPLLWLRATSVKPEPVSIEKTGTARVLGPYPASVKRELR